MSRTIYGILCHQNAEYVKEQYRLLFAPGTRFIYHADEKAPSELKRFLFKLTLENKNVTVISAVPCSWAGYSLTQTMLNIIAAATQLENWEHLAFLSELHLPLQNPRYIDDALRPNHNYFEFRPFAKFYESGKKDIVSRSSQVYRELPGVGMFGTETRTPPPAFFEKLQHGSQWMTLCRSTCLRLTENERPYRDIFQTSTLSDENAIQTWIPLLPEENVINENRILTYVSDPAHGGSRDMIFDEALFFKARDADYLFIRKRMENLPEALVDYYESISPNATRPADIEIVGHVETPFISLAVQSLIDCLNEKTRPLGFDFIPMKHGRNTPQLFAKLRKPELKWPFSIFIVSQDVVNLKLIAVKAQPFDGFSEDNIGGYRTSIARARLPDIAFNREIHLAADHDFGFYTMNGLTDLDGLVKLANVFLKRMIDLIPLENS